MLEIEEYLFKEQFDTKYLHQVSYLLDACAHHTVVQHITTYITVTGVYLFIYIRLVTVPRAVHGFVLRYLQRRYKKSEANKA